MQFIALTLFISILRVFVCYYACVWPGTAAEETCPVARGEDEKVSPLGLRVSLPPDCGLCVCVCVCVCVKDGHKAAETGSG